MIFSPKKLIPFFAVALVACNQSISKQEVKVEKEVVEEIKKEAPTKAELILADAIITHGGELYENAHYSFVFRGRTYSFQNNGQEYTYSMTGEVKGKMVKDSLMNNEFSRHSINGEKINLSEKQKNSYSESLNSVIYFATLPHKLKDKSVNKTYQGKESIKGEEYDVLKVTFDEEGGGKDFEDQYYYWINSKTKSMDYFGYNYKVNNGGVRFRSAYNKRVVNGIIFQDYINYKAPVGTPLERLPELYGSNQLKELSKIETENVERIHE